MQKKVADILAQYKLRDTQSRRLVLQTLHNVSTPLSEKEICDAIAKSHATINLVTVYRVLEKFEALGIVHRHHRSGGVVLCSLDNTSGHHIILSCEDCGKVEECCDTELCKHETRIAKQAGFAPSQHLSEIIGTCAACT